LTLALQLQPTIIIDIYLLEIFIYRIYILDFQNLYTEQKFIYWKIYILEKIYIQEIYVLENPVYKENNLYEGIFLKTKISNKFKF